MFGVLPQRLKGLLVGRRLDDAPVGGQPVMIRLVVRRFFCSSAWCPARTFAEQIEGLTSAYAAGTCPMGTDPAAVVDPEIRVRGITRLKVADASRDAADP
jgi:hypothetical protein